MSSDSLSTASVDPLYLAVHAMLVARLLHGQDSVEFLTAINRVIDVHDDMADEMAESEDEYGGPAIPIDDATMERAAKAYFAAHPWKDRDYDEMRDREWFEAEVLVPIRAALEAALTPTTESEPSDG